MLTCGMLSFLFTHIYFANFGLTTSVADVDIDINDQYLILII